MLVVSVQNRDTCAVVSVTCDHFHHHSPHRHTFLSPVVCRSPRVLGSPPPTGNCNPPLGPLRLEGGGLYLRTEQQTNKV